jgi:hypothetical protein
VSGGWIEAGLRLLQERYNPLFDQLITEEKLRMRAESSTLDSVDIRSAVITAATLANRRSLCLVLPDSEPIRPAFLFSYALLTEWHRVRDLGLFHRQRVIYFGMKPGIREQLRAITVSGLNESLGRVFEQVDLIRGAVNAAGLDPPDGGEGGLPYVVTSYSPAEPAGLIADFNPNWIAIDLADVPYASWLQEVLNAAKSRNISVIAWGTNPLSDAVRQFRNHADVLIWPLSQSFDHQRCEFAPAESIEVSLAPYIINSIHPLFLSGNHFADYNRGLGDAIGYLRNIPKAPRGPFPTKAIELHWHLVRTVESLCVPFHLYEEEAPHIWGLSPVAALRAKCSEFQKTLNRSDRALATLLESAFDNVSVAVDALNRFDDAPLWSALVQLLHQEPPQGRARAVVFSGRGRKELFLLALLARFNLTPDDLLPLRNWVLTAAELQEAAAGRLIPLQESDPNTIPNTLEITPILPGLPTYSQLPRLLPVFFADEIEVLMHRYQDTSFSYSARYWSDTLNANPARYIKIISALSGLPVIGQPPEVVSRVRIAGSQSVNVDSGAIASTDTPPLAPIWSEPDLTEEVSLLFDLEEDALSLEDNSYEDAEAGSDASAIVTEAIELRFSGGWRGIFGPHQRLNYVDRQSFKVTQRFVRSLRKGDSVLIIPRQRRQSLYGLIISRVHQHPAIELHLALLKRWHEELRAGFYRWSKHGRWGLDALLIEMQAKGSQLTSSLAIRFWLDGITLSPLDPRDLIRIAEILDLQFVKDRHKQIDAAASRIRGLHRSLSQRLNRWLEEQARGTSPHSQDAEVIDATLGLTFGDVRSSLVVGSILSVQEVHGSFLESTLGLIDRAAREEEEREVVSA